MNETITGKLPSRRSVAVVTGSRAEYGLYRPILRAICETVDLELRLMVCGMHLSQTYGHTSRRIEHDGFRIHDRIETLITSDDSPEAIGRSIAAGVSGFARAFGAARPDILMLLGDRYDMLAAALAAMPYAIPITHIHGGELTEGAIDDAIRHALTKLSHLHFVSTERYRHRVIQLGEQPDRVIVCGAVGLDTIRLTKATPREGLEAHLGLRLEPPPLLVTFHPTTLEYADIPRQCRALTQALRGAGRPIIVTYPNADTMAHTVIAEIETFAAAHANVRVERELGAANYFGMMAVSAAMVGNSSSGIIEAPSFRLPVVNIGNRQRGRIRAANVIDCVCEPEAIASAIVRATSVDFRESLVGLKNPYGDGHAAERIVAYLRSASLGQGLVEKRFFDLPEIQKLI
jgi:UDP-hydrolysing UDP-N-acetyl-D-glucosamine 2-epimerase